MASDKNLTRFLRHSGIYTIGSALSRLGAFLLLPLYTNRLTTAEYGTLELFYTASTIISGVLAVGLAHATLRFYFEYEQQRERNALVGTNLIASAIISTTGALLLASVSERSLTWVIGASVPRLAMPIVLVTLVLELSSQVSLAYLRARELSLLFICISFGQLVLQCLASTIFLVVYDAGVEGVLAGNLVAVAGGWLVLTIYVIRHCGLHFDRGKLMPVLRYSLPFLYTTVLAVFVASLDRFVITGLLSLEALGIYALATKFSRLIMDLIGDPFMRSYGAFRFTMMGRDDAAAMQARIVRYIAALLSVVGLAIIYFTGDVLRLMTNPSFWPAGELMPMLVFAAILMVLSYPAQTGILYNRSTQQLFNVNLLVSVVSISASVLLMWLFGLQGACAAALLRAILTVVLIHRASQQYFVVVYEYRRLALLFALLVAFYLLALPLGGLEWQVAVPAKLVLLLLFAGLTLRSRVFKSEERSFIGRAARNALAMRR